MVLAGGTSRRLGRDKLGEPVGGMPLLDRVLRALPAHSDVVCVGPERDTARAVRWVREEPAGAGPAAALAAGVEALEAPVGRVLVLAGDLPFVSRELLVGLLAVLDASVGAMAVDDEGREQPLLSAWPYGTLRDHLRAAGPLEGAGLLRTLAGLPRVAVRVGH